MTALNDPKFLAPPKRDDDLAPNGTNSTSAVYSPVVVMIKQIYAPHGFSMTSVAHCELCENPAEVHTKPHFFVPAGSRLDEATKSSLRAVQGLLRAKSTPNLVSVASLTAPVLGAIYAKLRMCPALSLWKKKRCVAFMQYDLRRINKLMLDNETDGIVLLSHPRDFDSQAHQDDHVLLETVRLLETIEALIDGRSSVMLSDGFIPQMGTPFLRTRIDAAAPHMVAGRKSENKVEIKSGSGSTTVAPPTLTV